MLKAQHIFMQQIFVINQSWKPVTHITSYDLNTQMTNAHEGTSCPNSYTKHVLQQANLAWTATTFMQRAYALVNQILHVTLFHHNFHEKPWKAVHINIKIFRDNLRTMVVTICQFPPYLTKIRESSQVNSLGHACAQPLKYLNECTSFWHVRQCIGSSLGLVVWGGIIMSGPWEVQTLWSVGPPNNS